jgi:hypothetical protein
LLGTGTCDRAGRPEPVSFGYRHTGPSPANVVKQKLRDQLAANEVQTRQICETSDARFLPQQNAIVRVVERIQRGEEGALAAAQNTEGIENDRAIGCERSLVFVLRGGLFGAFAEIDRTGHHDSLLPRLKKPRGRGSKVRVAFLLLAAKLLKDFGGKLRFVGHSGRSGW